MWGLNICPYSVLDGRSSREDAGKSSLPVGRQISANSNSLFEDVSYRQVDSEQREEFAKLLKKVRSIPHVHH